jgi:hypothetical protein
MTPELLERVATIVGAILTVMIFSYLLGDNILYRIAVSIFVGAAAAYTLIVALENVIIPWVQTSFDPAGTIGQKLIGVVPFVIGFLLLLKFVPALSRLGNLGLAAVLGVGTALAIWGAVTGSLVPLTLDAARNKGYLLDSVIAFIATVTVLMYFTYLGVRRPNGDVEQSVIVRAPGLVGQAFIMITLGATYGLLIISAATVLTGVIAQRFMIFKP